MILDHWYWLISILTIDIDQYHYYWYWYWLKISQNSLCNSPSILHSFQFLINTRGNICSISKRKINQIKIKTVHATVRYRVSISEYIFRIIYTRVNGFWLGSVPVFRNSSQLVTTAVQCQRCSNCIQCKFRLKVFLASQAFYNSTSLWRMTGISQNQNNDFDNKFTMREFCVRNIVCMMWCGCYTLKISDYIVVILWYAWQ